MASISEERGTGRRTIQFYGTDGRRRSIRLGKISKRQAESVKIRIEDLVGSAINAGPIRDETSRWLAGLDETLRSKLAAVGLIKGGSKGKLGEFIDSYILTRQKTVKPSTKVRWGQARRLLVEKFGEDRRLREFTEGDAEDFRFWLLGTKKMTEATVRKRCGDARMFFGYGLKHGLIGSNPFSSKSVPTAAVATKKLAFISDAEARLVTQALPNARWRLLFALSRWGGLRIPSEARALTWNDVDWGKGRLTVHAPKTEHIAGHESRVIPLFPEIEQPLREVFEMAEDGELKVLPFLSEVSGASLRRPLMAAIRRAGLKVWPRLWHNLRSSRQTELEQSFPTHVVCSWLGNNAVTAHRHYLQVTEDHFASALQNPVRYASAGGGNGPQNTDQNRTEPLIAAHTGNQVALVGLEPTLARF
jgi:integrase